MATGCVASTSFTYSDIIAWIELYHSNGLGASKQIIEVQSHSRRPERGKRLHLSKIGTCLYEAACLQNDIIPGLVAARAKERVQGS